MAGMQRRRWERRGLPWLLTAMPPVFLADQLPLIPLAVPVSRMSGLLLVAVLVAALAYPGPRRRLAYAWVPLGAAALSIPFLLWVSDPLVSLGGRIQWLVMVCAAMAVVRLCHDGPSVERLILRPLATGLALALVLVLSALAFDPVATNNGFGRFMPWGGNPNIVAAAFLPGVPVYGYLAFRTRSKLWPLAGLLTAVVLFLTGSRAAVATAGLLMVPFVLQRRGRVALLAAVGVVAWASLTLANPATLQRFEGPSSSAERLSIAGAYLPVIEERPWWGLAWTQGIPGEAAPEVGIHAHNAYIQNAYWGGLALAVPFGMMAAFSLSSAFYVWRRRKRFRDPLWSGVLVWTTVAIYIHGLSSLMAFFPTYIWAWTGLLALLLLLRLRADLLRQSASPSLTPELTGPTVASV